MSNNVIIHFRCGGRMYGIMMKSSVEDITLSMVEDKIYKKVGLDKSAVKLELSYIPLVVGCEEQLSISDDEDLSVYLASIDKENRRCMMYVEVITITDVAEQLSRVGRGSSFGMNYDALHSNDDGILDNAVALYVGNEEAEQQHEAVDEDADMDRSDVRDEFLQVQPAVEYSQFIEEWEDGLGVEIHQEFPNKKAVQELVDRAAFVNSFGFVIKKSDKTRIVLKCRQESCKWGLRASKIGKTDIFSIRTYTKMHTCSRASQSESNQKRKGTPGLVATLLNDDYPGQMETPAPKSIMDLVKTKLGLKISYSTALRGKNKAISDLRGSPEESYKLLYQYLYMLEKVNPGTITRVNVDENNKFKYLFIALGACIEGFQVMRKVIIVDATFLKKGNGGVLVFATAQDPNRHHYPIAFGVLDGENNASWYWFFEMLQAIVPDSSELVFISDRNASLIGAIATVYPSAHHAYCIWHLSQNVKGHATNVNKDVVAWRFMECSRHYTVAEFNCAYIAFKTRFPSAAKYLEETTVKEKWARCIFPGEKYNIDTSNCVESLNSVFRTARKYSLLPMIDTIIKKISEWFNDHRKDSASGSIERKLVPLVENYMHDTWSIAERLITTELNSYQLEYSVIGSDGKPYLVNLISKSCDCRVFDIERYPCVHALAAFIGIKRHEGRGRDIQLHDLCTKYYWSELWALAYYKTIYLVPDMAQWDVPDCIKEMHIIPPDIIKKKGRKKVKRFPSAGERRPRTKNKRCPRQGLQWLLFGGI